MLNTITINGRLTKKPELRYTTSGKPVASFTVACDRDYSDASGNKGTDYIDCVAWKQAEFVEKNFDKGNAIIVSGRLQIRTWTANDGTNRRTAEINVEHIYFGESKKKESTSNHEESAPQHEAPVFEEIPQEDEGDLPF